MECLGGGKPIKAPHYEYNGVERPSGGRRTGSRTGADETIGMGRDRCGRGKLQLRCRASCRPGVEQVWKYPHRIALLQLRRRASRRPGGSPLRSKRLKDSENGWKERMQ